MDKGINISDIEETRSKDVKPSKLLTGEYIKELDPKSPIEPDAELEKDEYLKFPTGEVQKVVGETHEKGGVKMAIPDGTKIMSDHLTLTKDMAGTLKKQYGLNVSTKVTFAEVLDKYTREIGLAKLNQEQEDVFETLEKELKRDIDKNTSLQNKQYLAQKIKSIEDKKIPLEEKRKVFFEQLFEMQETIPKPSDNEDEPSYKYGGISDSNFRAVAQKYNMTPEQLTQVFKRGGVKLGIPKYENGDEKKPKSIFVQSDEESRVVTGDTLTKEQKEELLKYYRKHNPQEFSDLKSAKKKWENVVVNKGLIEDLDEFGFDKIETGHQGKDKNKILRGAPTYGGMTPRRVENFTLREYYEATTGKDFYDASPEDIRKLQEQYDEDLRNSKLGTGYKSGVKGDVADSYFGNRTSSYLRYKTGVKGTKEGRIDVDRLFGKTKEEINKELEEYGLTYEDIKPYQNSAYKYVDITPPGEETIEDDPEEEPEVDDKGTPIVDLTKRPRTPSGPRGFFMPDQSVLPPSSQVGHLMSDIRLDQIDPIQIGIENNLQEINEQRNFVAKSVNNLPPSQRAAIMANLLATSQKSTNQAITSANVTNAQNQSQAELFNIGQFGQEEQFRANNALSFEQRQLSAKAKTEEEIRNYYDFNRKVALGNLQNQQKLNLLNSLFPDYNLDYFGATVDVDPNSSPEIRNRKAELFLNMYSPNSSEV
jgi:hypothetical protein